ncbi:hypothetical protein ACM55H_05290 [Flavobacterium sp. ZT3R17]|uniref:hypothetical protein n=1 Tax=Flavobacterium cryoconiti TaxID=3398736 RepID=UPI003A885BA5
MTENEKLFQSALLELAFEIGRNYEQIFLSLDLYNTINFEEMSFAQEKGAMYCIDNTKIENIVKAKYNSLSEIEQRKFQRLIDLKKQVSELPTKFKI